MGKTIRVHISVDELVTRFLKGQICAKLPLKLKLLRIEKFLI